MLKLGVNIFKLPLFWMFAFLFLLALRMTNTDAISLNGDEPRFLYYALSFWKGQFLSLPIEDWYHFLAANNIAPINPGHAIRSHVPWGDIHAGSPFIHSIIAAPILGLFQVTGARWLNFIVGICGLSICYRMLRKRFNTSVVLIATLLVSTSVPFFPNLLLFNTDMWLFLLFASILYHLDMAERTRRQSTILMLLICFFPFMHNRTIPIAAYSYFLYLSQVWTENAGFGLNVLGQGRNLQRLPNPKRNALDRYQQIYLPIIIPLLTAPFFLLTQYYLFGSFTNSSQLMVSLRKDFLPKILLEFFAYRHGVFLYSPILFLGVVGLFMGLADKKSRLMLHFIIMLIVYSILLTFNDAAESSAGRYWVMMMPIFCYGMAYYFSAFNTRTKAILGWILTLPFIAISLLNTRLMVCNKVDFFANRNFSYTYDYIYNNILPVFHFGLFLPWKNIFLQHAYDSQNCTRIWLFFLIFAGMGSGLIIFFRSQEKKFQSIGLIMAGLGLFSVFDLHKVRHLDHTQFQAVKQSDMNHFAKIEVALSTPKKIIALRVDGQSYFFFDPASPEQVEITATNIQNKHISFKTHLSALLSLEGMGKVTRFSVTELAHTNGTWRDVNIDLYEDRSWIRTFF